MTAVTDYRSDIAAVDIDLEDTTGDRQMPRLRGWRRCPAGSSILVMFGFERAGAWQAEIVGLPRAERRIHQRRIEAGCAMTSVGPKSPPLNQERRAQDCRDGIGHAVAEIEPCRMPARPAEPVEGS